MLKWLRRGATSKDVADRGRRSFFKAGAGAAVAGGAAVVAGTSVQAAETVRSDDGYRETDHMRRYYETARM